MFQTNKTAHYKKHFGMDFMFYLEFYQIILNILGHSKTLRFYSKNVGFSEVFEVRKQFVF